MKLDGLIGSRIFRITLLRVHAASVANSWYLQITGDGSVEVADVWLDIDDVLTCVAIRHDEDVRRR